MVSVLKYGKVQMRSGRRARGSDISEHAALCYILSCFTIIPAQVSVENTVSVSYSILYAVSVSAVPGCSGYIAIGDGVYRCTVRAAGQHDIKTVMELPAVERACSPSVFV